MNPRQTAECYALVASAYGLEASTHQIEAWQLLLGDLDGPAALEATKRLCLRDTPFPPRPGEIKAEVERMTNTAAPDLEAATGYYLAGNWDVHPAVNAAAQRVYWDRINAPDKARFQFRDLYNAELDHAETGRNDPSLSGPQPIGELLEGGDAA